MANFVPPANGASLGSYLVKNGVIAQNFSSIPSQIDDRALDDILGQKVGFSALCPGHTGPLPKKQQILGYDFLTKIS